MTDLIKAPKVPCGSCPYRRDVPAGLWHASEYDKLALYDGETWIQPQGLFMCHQGTGCLCGGWLLAHGTDDLLALRLHARELDPSVWSYQAPVAVFASGADAATHGKSGIDNPSPAARRMIDGLIRKQEKQMSEKTLTEKAAEQQTRADAEIAKANEYAQTDAPSNKAAEAYHRDQAAQAQTAADAYTAADKASKK